MNHFFVIEIMDEDTEDWSPYAEECFFCEEAARYYLKIRSELDVRKAIQLRVVRYIREEVSGEAEMMDEKRREMAREIREGERDTARERGYTEGLS